MWIETEPAGLVLRFDGTLGQSTLVAFVDFVHRELFSPPEPDKKRRARVINILLEQVQNMLLHSGTSNTGSDRPDPEVIGQVVVGVSDSTYYVRTSSWVGDREADRMRMKVAAVTEMTADEREQHWRENFLNSKTGDADTRESGNGLFVIAQEASRALDLQLEPRQGGRIKYTLTAYV